jgi:hypothetical protein
MPSMKRFGDIRRAVINQYSGAMPGSCAVVLLLVVDMSERVLNVPRQMNVEMEEGAFDARLGNPRVWFKLREKRDRCSH